MDRRCTEELKALAKEFGADLVGVTDLCRLKGIITHPPDLLVEYGYAVSVAVNLGQYRAYDNAAEGRAFSLLDEIAAHIESHIKEKGYKSLVIPPDKRVGTRRPLNVVGAISHKAVARAAGLGWIGKSTLLITPRFGPRICLVTLLTDMPLNPDRPLENMCGTCRMCIEACPADALTEMDQLETKDLGGPLDGAKCGSWLDREWLGGGICFECMLACPWGKPMVENPTNKEDTVKRLHNAWLGRQDGCRRQNHENSRPRIVKYGDHIQVVELCNTCYKTGKKEHRQLARILMEREKWEG